MSYRERTFAGKPVCLIDDISLDIVSVLHRFENCDFIVLISKPNSGKSTSATDLIFEHFDNVEYFTLTEQSRDNEDTYRTSTIDLGQEVRDKAVIIDELQIDGETSREELIGFVKELLENNKLILLSSP